MKSAIAVLLLLTALASSACVTGASDLRVSTYDKFSNEDTEAVAIELRQDMQFLVTTSRKRGAEDSCDYADPAAGFTYSSHLSGDSWRYLKVKTIDILVDDLRLEDTPVYHDGEVKVAHLGGVYTEETLVLGTLRPVLKLLFTASSLEVKIGQDVYSFSPSQMEKLRLYAEEICL